MKKRVISLIVFVFLLLSLLTNLIISQELLNPSPNFSIKIIHPENNNIFNKRQVFISLESNIVLEEISFIAENGKIHSERTLCKNCNVFYGSRTFDEGEQFLRIIGRERLDSIEYNISFFIDSTKPKLAITQPRSRSYFNGSNFMVQVIEKNPKSLFVYYGDSFDLLRSYEVNLSSQCILEENKNFCNFDIDLSEFNERKIYYKMILTDIADNIFESRPTEIFVDTLPPKINNPNSFFTMDRNYMHFQIDVDENNLKSISYMDSLEDNPKHKLLCSTLKNYLCDKKVSTRLINHNITLRVLDKAGNFAEAKLSHAI
ncbi:MAG: hypothetical protein WC867_01535 [Candidatus Pacearchaeota archaeon]